MFQFKNVDLDTYKPNESFTTNTKKITPGPYRATKLWNGIVRSFKAEMQCKRHRRHFKIYQDCFSASEAIDFLHKQLKSNSNIGKDVSRQQTIQLLKKFLKNHVIEDVSGKWGTENFEDDGKLFRFQNAVPIAKELRQPLATIDENVVGTEKYAKKSRKSKKTSTKTLKVENNNEEQAKKSESDEMSNSEESNDRLCNHSPKRPLPAVPEFPRCKVITRTLTEDEINNIWKNEVLRKIKNTLGLDSLSDILIEKDIDGSIICHNCNKIGKSGVVQVPKEVDLPYWALSAMTCLANWPHGQDTGLPCYPGFEKDVFKAVCAYYCGGEKCGLNQPLLTYDLYELFTNIVCLLQPDKIYTAVEATRYALLLLPPENRRKLHLLLRLLSKMSKNPHLDKLSGDKNVCTKSLLLSMFSLRILGCNEEVYLDEILAVQLAKFLIDHHNTLMKVPDDIQESVKNQIHKASQVQIRYGDPLNDGTYMDYGFINRNGVKMRQKHQGRKSDKHQRRKSADIMKSWDKLITTMKSKPTIVPLNDASKPYATLGRPQKDKPTYEEGQTRPQHQKRVRSTTLTSRFFGTSNKSASQTNLPDMPTKRTTRRASKKARMMAAKSCPDIADIYSNKEDKCRSGSSSSQQMQEKSSRRGSMIFSQAFSKLRRSRDNNISSD